MAEKQRAVLKDELAKELDARQAANFVTETSHSNRFR